MKCGNITLYKNIILGGFWPFEIFPVRDNQVNEHLSLNFNRTDWGHSRKNKNSTQKCGEYYWSTYWVLKLPITRSTGVIEINKVESTFLRSSIMFLVSKRSITVSTL